uniref:ABC transporter substrate-binding protein n=1 Tax=Halomonas sp. TaxID=1486246 RepID=UPI0026156234|nr:ABC transporter substrate-binding protein [Halomonas sp.]
MTLFTMPSLRKLQRCSLLGLAVAGAALAAPQAMAETISVACGSADANDYCPILAKRWAKETGHQVDIVSTPNNPTERMSLYQQLLGSESDEVDVLFVDIVWPGLLSEHLADLSEYLPDTASDGFFPALIDNNTIDGRLVALPWYTDAGLLYYRKDLLEKYAKPVPRTWEELTATANEIQDAERAEGNKDFWGYVFQGRAYEGLSCNALEWIASHGGGTLVDAEGKVTIDNPEAAAALDMAAAWIGTISPEGTLNHTEEETRGVFQSGNALFLRNWPYVWNLANGDGSAVQDKIGMAPLPHGPDGASAATLGGWNLAVSRYSKHPQLAAELVAYITAVPQQREHAIEAGMNPTIEALYQDPEVLASNPSMGELYDTLVGGIPRPSSITKAAYPRVSNALFNRVHEVLSGDIDGTTAVAQLQGELTRIGRRNW